MSFNDFLLTEVGILINVNLCINTVDIEIWSDSPWVDFDLSSINTQEHLVNLLELLNTLRVGFASEAKISADFGGSLLSKTISNTERVGMDSRWIFFSDSFDIHATLLRVNTAETLVLAVMQKGEVDLAVNINTLVNEDRSDWETGSRCLMSNQVVSNHAFSLFLNDFGSLDNMDSALHSRSEVSLSSTTSLDLCLNNETSFVAETLSDSKCLVSSARKSTLLHIDSIVSHKLFRVEFVQVEESHGHSGECGSVQSCLPQVGRSHHHGGTRKHRLVWFKLIISNHPQRSI